MSYHGPALRPLRGMGLLDPTATGLAVRPAPSCLTAAELAEAQSKCVTMSVHGLGQSVTRASSPMVGRLTGMDPCKLLSQELSPCPPQKCIDVATTTMIAGCLAGEPVAGVDCSDPWTGWTLAALSALPFCAKLDQGTIPRCLTKDQLATEFYCQAHPKSDGPDRTKNAWCWMVQHDAAYWKAYQDRLLCTPPVIHEVPAPPKPAPLPPPKAPPVIHEVPPPPHPMTTAAPPGPADVPPDTTEPPPEHKESAMFGVWGILALVAVGGGGYYLYRRYKR